FTFPLTLIPLFLFVSLLSSRSHSHSSHAVALRLIPLFTFPLTLIPLTQWLRCLFPLTLRCLFPLTQWLRCLFLEISEV
ncbi:hypothetical protein VIGAN_UM054600, partial [Vigna angularis var. angularis]